MPKFFIKTFFIFSISLFLGLNVNASQTSELSNSHEDVISNSDTPHKINGLIKKMINVASDVMKVQGDGDTFNARPIKRVYTQTQASNEDTPEGLPETVPDVTKPQKPLTNRKLTPTDQYDESNDRKTLVDQYFENKEKKNTLEDNINPLYWKKVREEYLKKREKIEKIIEKKEEVKKEEKLSVIDDVDTKAVTSEEGIEIFLKRRPTENYRNERLPDIISKKTYRSQNSHLPLAVYEEEYKRLLLKSILTQDIDSMRAIIERMGTTEVRDENGNTPLLYAVIAKNIVPIRVLVGMGASINIKNNDGISPVYIAAKDRDYNLLKLLIDEGGISNVITNNGKTLLMVAAENNDPKMVNHFIKEGHDVNQKMSDGNTALHFAAMRNSSLIADILITNGAAYDVRNYSGYTPIMIASAYGAKETVNLLIQSGADIRTTDALGQDAYILARNNNHNHIMSLILNESSLTHQYGYSTDYVNPIDETLSKAPIPFKRPDDQETQLMNNIDTFDSQTTPEDLNIRPLEMPLPIFTDEEKNQM